MEKNKWFPNYLTELWKQEHIAKLWEQAIKTEDSLERYQIIAGIIEIVQEKIDNHN